MKVLSLVSLSLVLVGMAIGQATDSGVSHSRLYCGTDNSGFNGMNGQLAVVHTDGANVITPPHVFNLDIPLNGLTFNGGLLLSGQPEDVNNTAGNILRTINMNIPPALVTTIPPGSVSFNSSCCNEQSVPDPSGGFYHAHYSDVIQRIGINSSGQSQVLQTFDQTDVVGMASDGVQIWISKWQDRQVGTWDPVTNTFTAVFSTPSNAGALAWDVAKEVLWVGMSGGSVVPYDASGNQMGPGFQPFGSISNTVDGLAFVPAQ